MIAYRILDLDNCISDDGWRIGMIKWDTKDPFDRYHLYHSFLVFDQFKNRDLLATDDEIVIFTGRPVIYRPATVYWLEYNQIKFKYLIMRNNEDHRTSDRLKAQQLDWLLGLYNVHLRQIAAAFDDRQEVIDAYKAAGVRNAQVRRIHDIDAYTARKENGNEHRV